MEFKKFLEEHRTSKSLDTNISVTHTSLPGQFVGSYHISNDELPQFYKIYEKFINDGGKASLTEKFPYKNNEKGAKEYLQSTICIDFDFRYANDIKDRQHTPLMVHKVVEILYKKINEIFDIKNPRDSTIVVQEKPNAYVDTSKSITKDGIHFIFPYLLCSREIQCIIRHETLNDIEKILSTLPSTNKIKDIYDESVSKFGSGWMMPLSSKPNCEAYETTNVFIYNNGIKEIEQEFSITDLSINKIYKMEPYVHREEYNEKFSEESLKLNRPAIKKTVSMPTEEDQKNEVVLVQDLIKLLDPQRAEDYDTWIYTGMCLHNINKDCNLPIWIEFSKNSEGKYEEGVCETMWAGFKDNVGGPSIGSLKRWAEEDNFYKAKEIINNSKIIEDVILASFFKKQITHHSVAKVIKKRAMENFVACDTDWYSFTGVRWKKTKDAMHLRKFISGDICDLYLDWAKNYNKMANESEDELLGEIFKDRAKKCVDIFSKLGDNAFKNKVIQECKELFIDEEFMEKIDSNRDLIGFENGVYDLKNKMFRQGHPHDYISFTTKIDYPENIKETDADIKKVNMFLEEVFPIPSIRKYALRFMSSCLSGNVLDQDFHVWTGEGGNGKSKIIELLKMVLGDYQCELPVGYLTQPRNTTNNASPVLMRTKSRRLCYMQEPNKNDTINIGIMKEISGGDELSGRNLYKDEESFTPMFKIVLMCNDLPKIPGMDNGTWRRIKVIEFISTFKDKPDEMEVYENNIDKQKYKCEFPIDRNLGAQFELWKGAFMWKLINDYKLYDSEGNEPPDEVTLYTDKYKAKEDIISNFVLENIVTDPNATGVNIKMIYAKFKVWCQEIGTMPKEIMKMPAVKEHFEKEKKLKAVRVNKTNKYRIKFIDHEDDADVPDAPISIDIINMM